MRPWGKEGRASGGCSTGGTAKRLGREQAGGAPKRGRQVWLFRETGVLRRRLAVSQWRAACDREDRRSSVRLCKGILPDPATGAQAEIPLARGRGGVWRSGRASVERGGKGRFKGGFRAGGRNLTVARGFAREVAAQGAAAPHRPVASRGPQDLRTVSPHCGFSKHGTEFRAKIYVT